MLYIQCSKRQPKHAFRNVLHLTFHIATKKKTDTYMLI